LGADEKAAPPGPRWTAGDGRRDRNTNSGHYGYAPPVKTHRKLRGYQTPRKSYQPEALRLRQV